MPRNKEQTLRDRYNEILRKRESLLKQVEGVQENKILPSKQTAAEINGEYRQMKELYTSILKRTKTGNLVDDGEYKQILGDDAYLFLKRGTKAGLVTYIKNKKRGEVLEFVDESVKYLKDGYQNLDGSAITTPPEPPPGNQGGPSGGPSSRPTITPTKEKRKQDNLRKKQRAAKGGAGAGLSDSGPTKEGKLEDLKDDATLLKELKEKEEKGTLTTEEENQLLVLETRIKGQQDKEEQKRKFAEQMGGDPKEKNMGAGRKDYTKKEQTINPDGSQASGQTEAELRMADLYAALSPEERNAIAIDYEAMLSSHSREQQQQFTRAAEKQVMSFLGETHKSLDKSDKEFIFRKFYTEEARKNLGNKPPEAQESGEPQVNNDDPNNIYDNLEDYTDETFADVTGGFTQEQVDSLTIDEQKRPPDQQDRPEFQRVNPQYNNMDISIDDVSPEGQGVLGVSQGGVAPNVSTQIFNPQMAGQLTSQNILNSITFPTEEAQRIIEDRQRNKKSIEDLKDEIRCFHLIYNDNIPEFKKNDHQKRKDDALQSKDINVVKAHHKSMETAIRNYFKTSDLKVGVILSAETFFGSGYAAAPNLAALTQPRVPELNKSNVRVTKPGHEFDGAQTGQTRVNRLGRNYRKPISRMVPKVGQPPVPQKLAEPPLFPDVERPMKRQFIARRKHQSQYIVKLKTGKR